MPEQPFHCADRKAVNQSPPGKGPGRCLHIGPGRTAPSGVDGTQGLSGRLLPITALNSWRETKVKASGKSCKILVDARAALSKPHASRACSWDPRKTARSLRKGRILTSLSSPESLCSGQVREEGKILHCPFLSKSRRLGLCPLSAKDSYCPSSLSHFVSWELGLAAVRLEAPKVRPDRNVGCAPFVASNLLCCQLSEQLCLSLSFLWLSLGVALDPGRVVSFACFWGTPLASMGLFSTARNTYCLSKLKTDNIFERIV